MKLLIRLIDYYCIIYSVFQDRITFDHSVTFSGKWFGHSKSFKWALIQACTNPVWQLLFFLFPKKWYQRLTPKGYVNLTRCNGLICIEYDNFGQKDGRYWSAFSDSRHKGPTVRRSLSWSVTKCLKTLK